MPSSCFLNFIVDALGQSNCPLGKLSRFARTQSFEIELPALKQQSEQFLSIADAITKFCGPNQRLFACWGTPTVAD